MFSLVRKSPGLTGIIVMAILFKLALVGFLFTVDPKAGLAYLVGIVSGLVLGRMLKQ